MDPSIDRIRASDGTGNANVATVQNVRSPGASTIIVNTVSGINGKFMGSMGTPHTFVDPITSETITVISQDTCVDFAGHIDGSNIEIDEIAPGYSDLGSEVGDIVIIRPTTQYADNLAETLAESHDDDGTINATDPKITGAIRDANDNELLKFSQTASAVNEITVKNAATGNAPEIQATGGDPNVSLDLAPKGTGRVTKNDNPIDKMERIGTAEVSGSATTKLTCSFTAKKSIRIEVYGLNAINGSETHLIRINDDSTSNNYSRRISQNSGSSISVLTTDTDFVGAVSYAAQNQQSHGVFECFDTNTGKARGFLQTISSLTDFRSGLASWKNTANAITSVTLTGATNGVGVGSKIIIYGSDD